MPDLPDDAERLFEAALTQGGGDDAKVAPAPTPEAMGAHFPDLEILELVGQGGMGVVYRARQKRLDRIVALKVLPRELGEDPQFEARFLREARTLAKLSHRNIVGVHEFGEADGQLFLLMEFVEGVTLRQLMNTGQLTPAQALAIVPQICEALQYAHEQGVVHRDIKPENVLLERGGRVKVADFGLAKLQQRAPGEFTLTGTGQVMGTLHYMAPEQYKTPNDVDHRADIFSLGVVFYEMLTGELPVGRFAAPSATKELDARLDEIVMRALERERDLRYQAANEIESEVRTVVDGPVPPPMPDAVTPSEAVPAPTAATSDALPERALALVWGWVLFVLSAPIGMATYFLTAAIRDDGYDEPRIVAAHTWGWGAAALAALIAALLLLFEFVDRVAKPSPARPLRHVAIPLALAIGVTCFCALQAGYVSSIPTQWHHWFYWFWQD